MRQETNKEMDLLLRRLSRRGDGVLRNGETGPDDDASARHLDVDELSSYAQNALPPAARARYTEHLADCGSCRKLVTELSLALGTVTVAAPDKAGLASSGLKSFLASLFSPMVLRYAVPALAVIVVMVIGFVALRRQQSERFVAQLEPNRVSEPVQPGLVVPASPTPEALYDSPEPQAQNEQGRVAQRGAGKRDGEVAGSAGASPATKQAPEEPTRSETRPLVAAAEPPPAAPKIVADGVTNESKEKKAEAEAKKEPQPAVGTADTAKAEGNKNAAEPATVSERRVASLPQQNRSFKGLGTLRPSGVARARDDKDSKSDKDEIETRSVAGRNFKKERGIWIDTAYDSSTDTVNLARGSEQFRALVADEPAIKTIAEKLDGEVIVVWKGRAYHIR